MALTDTDRAFLQANRSAAQITLRPDGTPHAARVGLFLHGEKLWSSSTQSRLRTSFLRRDPRSTLFVFDAAFAYLTLETTVTILDGTDVAELSLQMFWEGQGGTGVPGPDDRLGWFNGQLSPAEFLQTMRDEGRIIYEFEVHRSYGLG